MRIHLYTCADAWNNVNFCHLQTLFLSFYLLILMWFWLSAIQQNKKKQRWNNIEQLSSSQFSLLIQNFDVLLLCWCSIWWKICVDEHELIFELKIVKKVQVKMHFSSHRLIHMVLFRNSHPRFPFFTITVAQKQNTETIFL